MNANAKKVALSVGLILLTLAVVKVAKSNTGTIGQTVNKVL